LGYVRLALMPLQHRPASLPPRSRSTSEFFEIDEQQVISALMISGGKEATPGKDTAEDEESLFALEKATERRSRFKFSMIDLKKGDVISYIKTPGVSATV